MSASIVGVKAASSHSNDSNDIMLVSSRGANLLRDPVRALEYLTSSRFLSTGS